MKLTDLMVVLIVFGMVFTGAGYYIFSLESQYGSMGYSEEYNPNQYASLIDQQASKADGASNLASANTELGSEGTATNPYENIFVSGWNAIKDLIGVGSDIQTLSQDLRDTSEGTGLNIPPWVWAGLSAIVALIVLTALINSSQRVEI